MWPYRLVWLVALVAGYFSAYAQPDLGRSLPPLPSGYWLEMEETIATLWRRNLLGHGHWTLASRA